jgi:phage terminase large subunit-like protein
LETALIENLSTDESISPAELVRLCAIDSELFCKVFFKKAFRQESPSFARKLWSVLDAPQFRLVNAQLFRGAGKTTRLRAFTAKRIAYGLSRTILYVGKSEDHAIKSINWIKQQVEHNSIYRDLFQLSPGERWRGEEAQIKHGIESCAVWIKGMGVTGSIRGINFDDFRPDLIVADDILDEENTATPEQREKLDSLLYGALMNGLAPASENPDAKLVLLQTPLNRDDQSSRAATDPAFTTIRIPCWTEESADRSVEYQCSVWPARWADSELRSLKQQYIGRNQLSIWMREWEVKIIAPELSTFRSEWLEPWSILPAGIVHILVIDPVPPPGKVIRSDSDYEAIAVIGAYGGNFYIREISVMRGHDPQWTLTEAFRLAAKYRPLKWVVEANAYQRTLAWLIREEMKRLRRYWQVDEYTSVQSKYLRIVDGLTGPASNGAVFYPPVNSMEYNSDGLHMFLQQFAEYPNVSHDDALEAVAIGISNLTGKMDAANDEFYDNDEDEIEPLKRNKEAMCP